MRISPFHKRAVGSLALAVLLIGTACSKQQKAKPAAAPPGTPESRPPAWSEAPQDQRSDEKKAIDSATHGSSR